jgi:hypothetical protein
MRTEDQGLSLAELASLLDAMVDVESEPRRWREERERDHEDNST